MNQKILKEILQSDVGQSKTLWSGGRFSMGLSVMGSGKAIPIYLAIIPSENKEHLCWVACTLWQVGVNLDQAIPTDHGPLVAAADVLSQCLQLYISLKFCEELINRNLNSALRVQTSGWYCCNPNKVTGVRLLSSHNSCLIHLPSSSGS
jgi:hypothetical protein